MIQHFHSLQYRVMTVVANMVKNNDRNAWIMLRLRTDDVWLNRHYSRYWEFLEWFVRFGLDHDNSHLPVAEKPANKSETNFQHDKVPVKIAPLSLNSLHIWLQLKLDSQCAIESTAFGWSCKTEQAWTAQWWSIYSRRRTDSTPPRASQSRWVGGITIAVF